MIMELIHKQKMNKEYKITNVSKGEPPTTSTFNFKDHLVEIKETIIDEESHIDPWSNKIGIADLSLKLDGKEIDSLKGYPIRVDEEGLNRYYGEIAYLSLTDKGNGTSQFIVLLKKTKELQKEMPNGDIVGWVQPDKLKYMLYAFDEDGHNLNQKSFNLSDRSALQTELLNVGAMVPHSIGYYTDAWEGYPTLFFPLIFPFLTLLLGLVLILVFLKYNIKKRSE